MKGHTMLKLENITAGYEKSKPIIKSISTTITDGGICGILGPNGSGKTTLLRALAGIISCEGEIELNSITLTGLNHKQLAHYAAMTPQFSSIYFSYSVYDTIMMGRYVHKGNTISELLGGVSKIDKEKVDETIELMGLNEYRDIPVNQLSGGQLERVLLARTFVQETPVILLDEPTNHLDMKYQIELMDHLKKWSAGTTTVDGITYKNTAISVFHDVGTAALISDEIILMKDGCIQNKGPVNQMIDRDKLQNIYDTDVINYYKQVYDKLT